jgi:RimJ/RimL family protein N-acetyltransferase
MVSALDRKAYAMPVQPDDVTLRDVEDADLDTFFTQQLDPGANWMAAFTRKDFSDRAAFLAHWARIRADPTNIIQTVLSGERVAGSVSSYEDEPGQPEVTYWLGREFWGQGIATHALTRFLADHLTTRPVHARVAKDNAASLRVLQKCGFTIIGESSGYAAARNAETEEYLLRRDG